MTNSGQHLVGTVTKARKIPFSNDIQDYIGSTTRLWRAQEWLYYYTTCGKVKIYSTCRRGHDSIACERLRLLSEAEFYKVKG